MAAPDPFAPLAPDSFAPALPPPVVATSTTAAPDPFAPVAPEAPPAPPPAAGPIPLLPSKVPVFALPKLGGPAPASADRFGNLGAGINEGLSNVLGAPVDLATMLLNAGSRGAGDVLHATGLIDPKTHMPQIDHPIGGSEDFQRTAQKVGIDTTPDSGSLLGTVGNLIGTVPGFGETLLPPSLRPPRIPLPGPRAPRPFASPKPVEAEVATPAPGTAGNINLAKINGPDEIRNLLKETAETEPSVAAATRGKISLEEQQQLANDVGMTAGKLGKRTFGQAFNAETAIAARRLLTESAADVFAKAKAARGGSDADVAAFQEAMTRHRAIQEQVSGMTAEAGRALGSFRVAVGAGDPAKALKGLIDAGGGRDNIEGMANTIANLDPSQLGNFVATAWHSRLRDKAKALWMNLILSGPQTHAANITSNFATLFGSEVPEAFASAALGKLHGGEKTTFTDATARLYGYLTGIREGVGNAGKAFWSGEPQGIGSKIDLGSPRQTRLPFGNSLPGKALTVSTRLLSGEDELFKSMASRGELWSQGVRQAQSEGVTGFANVMRRASELVRNPTPDMLDAAVTHAQKVTFQSPLGEIGQLVTKLRNKVPFGTMVMPFVQTPANIFKYAAERTPLGFAMKQVREDFSGKNGAIARDGAVSRMTLGTSAATALGFSAAEGKISGAGPADPQQRAAMLANGWQPYSVKIGDTWYSYRRLDPFASILGPVADLVELTKQIPSLDGSKVGAAIVASIAGNLTDKTFLSGLSSLAAAIHDPQQYGQSWINSLTSSIVPAGLAQYTRTEDPIIRDAKGMIDAIRARIPGQSEMLPPKLTLFGEPARREGGLGPDILSPIATATAKNDPVWNEMIRLQTVPAQAKRQIQGVDLMPAEYAEFVQLAGKPAKELLGRLVASPKWASIPDPAKSKIIEDVITKERRAAETKFLAAHPNILKQSLDARRAQFLGAPAATP